MKDKVIGVDIGTKGVRAVVFDKDGTALGEHYVEYSTNSPYPGWAEQNLEEIFKAFLKAIPEATKKSKVGKELIAGVGLSSVMFSIVALNEKGEPLTELMTLHDSRAVSQIEKFIMENDTSQFYKKTGCKVHPMYPFSKILWMKEKATSVFVKTFKFISVKEYIIYRLFGRYVVDTSIASSTGYFNVSKLKWEESILDLLGISPDRLSEVVDGFTVLEGIEKKYSDEMDLFPHTPFVVGAGDGMLFNVACGNLSKGKMTSTIGTTGTLRLTLKTPFIDAKERTWCYHLFKDYWICGGTVNNGGLVLRWYTDQLGAVDVEKAKSENCSLYGLYEKYAGEVPVGSDGLVFLPYLTQERCPHYNPNAKGVFFGLTQNHTRKHVIRAIMESVIYRMYSVYEILKDIEKSEIEVFASGGYTLSSLWVKIQADVFNAKVNLPSGVESSPLGAGVMAMKAFDLIDEVENFRPKIRESISPDAKNHEKYLDYYKIAKRIYSNLQNEFDDISVIVSKHSQQ